LRWIPLFILGLLASDPARAQESWQQGADEIIRCSGIAGRALSVTAVVDDPNQVLSSRKKQEARARLEAELRKAGVELKPFADAGRLLEIADDVRRADAGTSIVKTAGEFDAIAIARAPVLRDQEIGLTVDLIATSGKCKSAPIALVVATTPEQETADIGRFITDFAEQLYALRPNDRPKRLSLCPAEVRDGNGPPRASACSAEIQDRLAEALLKAGQGANAILKDAAIEILPLARCGAEIDGASVRSTLRVNGKGATLRIEARNGPALIAARSPRPVTGLPCDPKPESFTARLASGGLSSDALVIEGSRPFKIGDAFSVTLAAKAELELACWVVSDRGPDGRANPSGYVLTKPNAPLRIAAGERAAFPPAGQSIGSFAQVTPDGSTDLLQCFGAPEFSDDMRRAVRTACGPACNKGGAPKLLDEQGIQRLVQSARGEKGVLEAVFDIEVRE
jgi:hypothetical protein